MNSALIICAASFFLFAGTTCAQLQLLADEVTPIVFGGEAAVVPVRFRNAGEQSVDSLTKIVLFQLSTSTRMPVATQEWKRLTVLSGQSVLEQVMIKFPETRAITRFEVRWLNGDNLIGRSMVTVCPTNLLKELADIGGDKPFAVFDPDERLIPLLRALKLEFDDLNEGERIETWRGQLAIVGPVASQARISKHATALAQRGIGVLLLSTNLLPEMRSNTVLVQSVGNGRMVMAPSESVAGLSTNASAQLTLLRLARLAVRTNWLETN